MRMCVAPPEHFLLQSYTGPHPADPALTDVVYRVTGTPVPVLEWVSRHGRNPVAAAQFFDLIVPELIALQERGVHHGMLGAGTCFDEVAGLSVHLLGVTPAIMIDTANPYAWALPPESRAGPTCEVTEAADVYVSAVLFATCLKGRPVHDVNALQELAGLPAAVRNPLLQAFRRLPSERPSLCALRAEMQGWEHILAEAARQPAPAQPPPIPKPAAPRTSSAPPHATRQPMVAVTAEFALPASVRGRRVSHVAFTRSGVVGATARHLIAWGDHAAKVREVDRQLTAMAVTERGDVLTLHRDGTAIRWDDAIEANVVIEPGVTGPLGALCQAGGTFVVAGASGVAWCASPYVSGPPALVERDAPSMGPITAMARAASGRWFVAGFEGLRAFAGVSPAARPWLRLTTPVRAFALHPSEETLVTAGFDHALRFYDLRSASETPIATLTPDEPVALAWLPWLDALLIAGARGTRLLHRSGALREEVTASPTWGVAVDPLRQRFALALEDAVALLETPTIEES
jgi:hypothetical protein